MKSISWKNEKAVGPNCIANKFLNTAPPVLLQIILKYLDLSLRNDMTCSKWCLDQPLVESHHFFQRSWPSTQAISHEIWFAHTPASSRGLGRLRRMSLYCRYYSFHSFHQWIIYKVAPGVNKNKNHVFHTSLITLAWFTSEIFPSIFISYITNEPSSTSLFVFSFCRATVVQRKNNRINSGAIWLTCFSAR